MNVNVNSLRRFVAGGSFALALVVASPATVLAQSAPGANPLPSYGELPSPGNLVLVDEITSFSMHLQWLAAEPFPEYSVGIQGGNRPGRFYRIKSPLASRRGSLNLNRLVPDTDYSIVVKGFDGQRWSMVGFARKRTTSEGGVSIDLCKVANLEVRNISPDSAEVILRTGCRMDSVTFEVTDLTTNVKKTVTVTPTSKTIRHIFRPLASKREYKVRAIQSGAQPRELGEPVIFQTL